MYATVHKQKKRQISFALSLFIIWHSLTFDYCSFLSLSLSLSFTCRSLSCFFFVFFSLSLSLSFTFFPAILRLSARFDMNRKSLLECRPLTSTKSFKCHQRRVQDLILRGKCSLTSFFYPFISCLFHNSRLHKVQK